MSGKQFVVEIVCVISLFEKHFGCVSDDVKKNKKVLQGSVPYINYMYLVLITGSLQDYLNLPKRGGGFSTRKLLMIENYEKFNEEGIELMIFTIKAKA